MRIRRQFLFFALAAALISVASCVEDPKEPDRPIKYTAGNLTLTKISPKSVGEKLTLEWKAGDIVWLGSDAGDGASYTLKEDDVAGGGSSARLDYGKMLDGATLAYLAVLGRKGESSLNSKTAHVVPAYDGSLEEALLLASNAVIGTEAFSLSQMIPMVEFTLVSEKVASVTVSVAENAFPEELWFDMTSGELTAKRFKHTLTVSAGDVGFYYLPISSGVGVAKFDFSFYDADGTLLLQKEVENSFSVSPGRILSLGEVDSELKDEPEEPDREYFLTVPMVFNNGSAVWPFKEGKGSSSKHSSSQVFHTNDGYAVFFSGIEHVLHSSNGWVVVVRTENDFVEFPTFTKARIKSVKVRYGTNPANVEFVDSKGNILRGGEQRESVESGGEYLYEFSDTEKGEPCRMRFKTKKNVAIREMIPTYVFDSSKDAEFTDVISSVWLNDAAGGSGLSAGVGVNGSLTPRSGNLNGVTCGIEYRDYYSNATPVPVDCTPASFSYESAAPALAKYIFRAWAAPESGWREYTEDRVVDPNSIVLDFFQNGELNKVLEKSCVTKSSSGIFNYNNADGLVVASTGVMTCITFPAIPGKSLAEVLVVPASSSGVGNLLVCQNPASEASAETTKVAEAELNIVRGTSLFCETTVGNTAYSLSFSSSGTSYRIKRIIATYRDSDIPTHPEEEEPDDPAADPVGLFDYKVLCSAGHPRLLVNAEGLAEIRHKITLGRAYNPVLCDISDCVMYYANLYVSKPTDLSYKLDASGKRLLDVSRSALLQLGSFAYAYNMTGDKKYLNRAKEIIAQICSFPDWHPSHFLDTAEMTLAAAFAYDWLYNALSLEERILLHSRIVNYGLLTSYKDDYVTTPGNWNQVCAAGMVAGALAVYEKDKNASYEIIERNVQSNLQMAREIYYPDGNYSEGYSYWRYGTGFQTILIGMLERIFGHSANLDAIPGFDKTAEYMLFMDGVTGAFGYADGGTTGHAAKTGMWWFAGHLNDMSVVSNELRLLRDVAQYREGSESRVLFTLPPIVNKLDVDYDVTVHHDKNLWYGRGKEPIVMVHTGWNWDETDHYLGIKAGVPSDGHDHMDVGSFVYEALGRRWSTDLGKYNYADMENAFRAAGGAGSGQTSLRWDVLKLNNYGHSTISINAFDGTFQKRYVSDHNFYGMGTITSVIENPGEYGAVIDMTGPLQGQVASATRTIKLVNDRDLVIVDVIRTKDDLDAPVLWHMITPASVAVQSDHEILANGGKTLYLSTSSSIPLEIKYIGDPYIRPPWFTPRDWDDPEEVMIAGYECTIPKGQTVTLTTTLSPTR